MQIRSRGRCALFILLTAAACSEPTRRIDTVLYASGAELQSINPLLTVHPLAKQVQKFVLFTTLARYDANLRPTPYLAESWAWSEDGKALFLQIRRDVFWHDGARAGPRDVVWTLQAARDPATGYPRAADLATIVGVELDGPDGVTVRFSMRPPQFPDVLTDLAVLPAHHLGGVAPVELRGAAFNRDPVGNGPFRFVRHDPNRRWVFERNEHFPPALGGPPRLERLVIAIVDEATTKLAALVAGELDVAGINPTHAPYARDIPHLVVRDYPLLFSVALIMNLRRPPFDDPRVRRALAFSLDRELMVASYLYGFGEPAWGLIPPAHPAYSHPPQRALHRDSARALLLDAGYGPDRPLTFEILTVASSDNPLEQLIAAQLAPLGVRVRIRPVELGAFLERAQSGRREFESLVTGLPGDLELSHLRGLLDSRRIREPLQYAGYQNPDVDRALDRHDWPAVEQLVGQDVPVIFLYHARGVQGVTRRLQGVHMDLRGELPTVTDWWLRGGAG